MRGGDNIESVYWLYNRTGEKWLLDLADEDPHAHAPTGPAASSTGTASTSRQGFREPAEYWMQRRATRSSSRPPTATTTTSCGTYGQMPGGVFVADENFRPGYIDPRQGFETCWMVEFMHSFEMLTRITGDAALGRPLRGRRVQLAPGRLDAGHEGAALPHLRQPGAARPRRTRRPGIENGGTMFSYSPYEVYRCCQHNVVARLALFRRGMWLATSDNGLCLSLYAPSEVTAKVGDARHRGEGVGGDELPVRRKGRVEGRDGGSR